MAMDKILKLLLHNLDADGRMAVQLRVEAMTSELKFLQDTKPEQIKKVSDAGWPPSRLEAVIYLNSFYQRIIAPLWASAYKPCVVGATVPIRYGTSLLFNEERNKSVDQMGATFLAICSTAKIERFMLEAARTSDLIYHLGKITE